MAKEHFFVRHSCLQNRSRSHVFTKSCDSFVQRFSNSVVQFRFNLVHRSFKASANRTSTLLTLYLFLLNNSKSHGFTSGCKFHIAVCASSGKPSMKFIDNSSIPWGHDFIPLLMSELFRNAVNPNVFFYCGVKCPKRSSKSISSLLMSELFRNAMNSNVFAAAYFPISFFF